MRRGLVVVVAVWGWGCAGVGVDVEQRIAIRSLHPPPDLMCADRQPVRLLVDVRCRVGICGWSCAPDRWRP